MNRRKPDKHWISIRQGKQQRVRNKLKLQAIGKICKERNCNVAEAIKIYEKEQNEMSNM